MKTAIIKKTIKIPLYLQVHRITLQEKKPEALLALHLTTWCDTYNEAFCWYAEAKRL